MIDGRAWLPARWEAPARVRAGTSTRIGGCSIPPWEGLNLADHVGDTPENVDRNRRDLAELLGLPSDPAWLNQVHGARVIRVGEIDTEGADGCYTDAAGEICAVMTADCLPLLLSDRRGEQVASVHVGWRGFCAGIVGSGIARFGGDRTGLLAWIGPHIGAASYEVGEDVREACLARDPVHAAAFSPNEEGRWQLSLESLVRRELTEHGISRITAAGYCTRRDAGMFYSYRRDGRTGRMGSLIWIDA